MKKLFVFLSGLMFSFILSAQIVLNLNDLPKVGDSQISVRVDSLQGLNIQHGNPGTNMLWDFSNLLPCCGTVELSTDTLTWENHDATPNSTVFPLSDIVHKEKCYISHSHVTHLDETLCYYNHYIRDNSGLLYYGLEDPVNIAFTNYWNVFPLLAYGDSLQNTAIVHIPISSDSNRVYHIDYFSIADAWGTIKTPDSTVEALRVYTYETVFDTLYINGNPQQINSYTGNFYYRWYSKELGFPVLEIAKGMQTQVPPYYTQVKYAKKLASSGGTTDSNKIDTLAENIKLYPNPFSDFATFSLPQREKPYEYSLSFTDVLGREIRTYRNIKSKELLIKKENLTAGIYFYELSDGGLIGSGKIVVQ